MLTVEIVDNVKNSLKRWITQTARQNNVKDDVIVNIAEHFIGKIKDKQ